MGDKGILNSLRTWLADSHRYLKGAEPIPGALENLVAYLSDRPTLDSETWSEQARKGGINLEVARFVFEFLRSREVPVGQVQLDDRLEADLNLNSALPQEWGDEFQEEFMDRFGVGRLFKPGPPLFTIGDLLSFVQQELDDWRRDTKKDQSGK